MQLHYYTDWQPSLHQYCFKQCYYEHMPSQFYYRHIPSCLSNGTGVLKAVVSYINSVCCLLMQLKLLITT